MLKYVVPCLEPEEEEVERLRNWSKETLAKNVMLNALWRVPFSVEEYNVVWLDAQFKGAISFNKDEIAKRQKEVKEQKRLLRKWEELYGEYLENKDEFVRRYYTKTRPSLVKLGGKYNTSYGRLVYMLDKLVARKRLPRS